VEWSRLLPLAESLLTKASSPLGPPWLLGWKAPLVTGKLVDAVVPVT
jgi:hypothetical protein